MLIVAGGLLLTRWALPALLVAAAALVHPALGLGAILAWAVWQFARTPADVPEADFYQDLLLELASGLGVRAALSAVCGNRPGFEPLARQLAVGGSNSSVASGLVAALPRTGSLAAASFAIGAEAGADLRPVVSDLAAAARALDEVDRHVKVHTAQARLSALIVGVLPAMLGIGLAVFNPPEAGVGRLLMFGGLGLQVLGLGVVAWMLRR